MNVQGQAALGQSVEHPAEGVVGLALPPALSFLLPEISKERL